MTLTQQVYAQAVLLSGAEEPGQEQLLKILCRGAVNQLTARLREGIRPEDCKADFVASAALYALAALSEVDPMKELSQIQVGDVTMKRSGSAAAVCLRNQAALMMSPYLKDTFSFRGV